MRISFYAAALSLNQVMVGKQHSTAWSSWSQNGWKGERGKVTDSVIRAVWTVDKPVDIIPFLTTKLELIHILPGLKFKMVS
jgi:hypothetical protein